MKNNTSFYEKCPVVLVGISYSIEKNQKLGIRYEPQFGISKTCFCLKIVSTKTRKEDCFSYIYY